MTKQPSYRFAGYTEPWKEKKLGEVADFTKGKGYSKGDLESSGVPIILYGRLYTNYQTIIDDVDTYVTMKEHSVLSEGNEIIVPSSGESSEEISRASVVAKKGVILGGDLNIIRLTEKFSSVFVAITLSNGSQQKELSKRAQGKSVVHLHNSDLKEVNLFYTSLPEQTAIGSFFQDIDQFISLQQRKLEMLKEQKKTYLKLLFPAKGQTKPDLRFVGFEDEWKEVKLGEIGEIQTGNTPPTNEEDNYEKNGFPWVTPTDINSLVLHTTSKQLSEVGKSKARIAKSGSILVTCIASIGKNTLVRTDSAFNQQINSLTPSEKYSSYFLLTQSEIWSRYMLSIAGAGTMQIINKSDFSNIKAMVPTLPEQEAIGSFFQDLDKAIAKQEEKVNQLKESKQTLLRKMFI